MYWLLNSVVTLGPLILGTYISIRKKLTKKTKIVVWIICVSICFCNIWQELIEKKEKNKETKTKDYYYQLNEEQYLYSIGYTKPDVKGLGKNPLLKHYFREAQSYEGEFKFKEAIEEYKRCKSHPKATAENKFEANILISYCYIMLSETKKAEIYFKKALDESKRIEDKDKMLKAKASTLSNLGIIHSINKPDKALKYYKEALEIHRKIGDTSRIEIGLNNISYIYNILDKPEKALEYKIEYLEIQKKIQKKTQNNRVERGIAWALGDIGHIYIDLRKPSEALKYSEEALEIHKKIGDTLGELRIATNLESIGSLYSDLGKPDEALKCHTEALEIYKKNGFKLGIVMQLHAISSIYNDLGKFEEALKYSKEAKEIYDKSNINERFRSRLFRNLGNDVIEKE
jgi:tetratricopeptide (TPR) repeat protein